MIVRDDAGRLAVQVTGDRESLDDLVRRLRWLRDRLVHDGAAVPALLEPLVDDTAAVAALTALAVADVGNVAGSPVDGAAESFVTVSEAVGGLLRGVPARTLRHQLRAGRYPGARPTTAGWLIPLSALKEALNGRA